MKKPFRWIPPRSWLLFGALLSFGDAGAQQFPPDEHLRLILRYVVEDTDVPGVVLGVVEADGSTRVVSYGSSGSGAEPLSPRSGFQIASVTKTFTATLLAEMVLRGEVALDDPVAKYLPESVSVPSRGDRKITLLDLATHTSGLPPYPDDLTLRGPDPMAGYTIDDLYAFLSAHELRNVPGAGYRYSNVGYGLLAHALARAGVASFRDLLRERVFDPLGMERTDIAVAGELGAWMAVGHRRGRAVPHWFATEALQGAGAAVSTAEDLLIFLRANTGRPATDLERAMQMAQEPRVQDGRGGAGWGFSWRTGVFPDGSVIRGHGGESGGFRSRITFAPDRRMGVVVLANDVHFAEDLETSLLYLEPPAGGWIDRAIAPEVLERYSGTYVQQGGEDRHFVRREDEGYLTYQAAGTARTRLYARSDSTFYSLRSPSTFTFRIDGPARVTMVIEEDERSRRPERTTLRARRVSDLAPPPRESAGGEASAPRRGRWSPALVGLLAAVLVIAALALRRVRRA